MGRAGIDAGRALNVAPIEGNVEPLDSRLFYTKVPDSHEDGRMYQLTPTDWIWRNGDFVAWQDANVHVLAHSMQFGSSAFEGVRCYSTPRGPAIFRMVFWLR